jgi:hypothetical protein
MRKKEAPATSSGVDKELMILRAAVALRGKRWYPVGAQDLADGAGADPVPEYPDQIPMVINERTSHDRHPAPGHQSSIN